MSEEEVKETVRTDPVIDGFGKLSGHPDQAQVDQWKNLYGEVHLLGLDETTMYIFRPIRRLEYKGMVQNSQDEAAFQEQIIQKCVLWPKFSPEMLAGCKGGDIEALFTAIMECSNFLQPQVVLSLVRKL